MMVVTILPPDLNLHESHYYIQNSLLFIEFIFSTCMEHEPTTGFSMREHSLAQSTGSRMEARILVPGSIF